MSSNQSKSPKRRVRPGELLLISAVFGIFTLGITFMGSRQLVLSLIFGGLAFIFCVVVFSILSLAASPLDDKRDITEPVLGQPFPLAQDQQAGQSESEHAKDQQQGNDSTSGQNDNA